MATLDKDKFLEIFRKALGNVSVACTNFGCDRTTFYDWYNNDPDFRAKADAVKEIRKDFIESALDKRIQEGDTTAIIFAAKTLCKDRGFVEKQEVDQKTNVVMSFDEQKEQIRELIKMIKDV